MAQETAWHKKQPEITYKNAAYLNKRLRTTTIYTGLIHGPSILRAFTFLSGALCNHLSVIPSTLQSICRVKIAEENLGRLQRNSKSVITEFLNTLLFWSQPHSNRKQKTVDSGQWPVDSGQWPVDSGQWTLHTTSYCLCRSNSPNIYQDKKSKILVQSV